MSEGDDSDRIHRRHTVHEFEKGKNLEEAKAAQMKGESLTREQKRLVKESALTLMRHSLTAFKYLKKVYEIELWISKVLGLELKPISTESRMDHFISFLRSGVVLCQLANKIKPGVIKKFNSDIDSSKRHHHFKALENIWFFLESLPKLGADPRQEAFSPIDLFESKNINKVVDCLISLAHAANQKLNFEPKLELMDTADLEFSQNEVDVVAERLERDEEESKDFEDQKKGLKLRNGLRSSSPLRTRSEASIGPPEIKKESIITSVDNSPKVIDEVIIPKPTQTTEEKKEIKSEEPKEPITPQELDNKPTPRKSASLRQKKEKNYAAAAEARKKSKKKQQWNADEVMKGLYLGDMFAAANQEELKKRGITHVLNLIGGEPQYPESFKYLIVTAYDTNDHDMIKHFSKTNEFIAEGRAEGGVIVHCQKGVSRSATAVIGYMMARLGYSFYDAADFVCEKRPVICPNLGFIKQLQLYEQMKFQLQGDTESHIQYKKIRIKSFLNEERDRWSENISTWKKPFIGDELLTDESHHILSKKFEYKCKNCQFNLGSTAIELPHESEEEGGECDSIFISPLSWMGDLLQTEGILKCHQCQGEVGKWNWNQSSCRCGFSNRPSFVLFKEKIDLV